MTPLGLLLILLCIAISIIVTYFIVKIAVCSAIIEAQRIGNAHAGLDRVIKRAVLEALQEHNEQKKSNEV